MGGQDRRKLQYQQLLLRERYGEIQLACCSLCFGIGFLFQHYAQTQTSVGPISYSFARNAISAVLMVLSRRSLIDATSESPEEKTTDIYHRDLWVYGLICGVCNCFGSILQQVGLATVSAGKTAFITSLYMIVIPFAEGNGNFRTYLAASIAAAGVHLLSGCTEQDVCIGGAVGFGEACVLASLLFWVVSIMAGDAAADNPHVNVIDLTVLDFVFSAGFSLVIAMVAEPSNFAYPFVPFGQAGWCIAAVGATEAVGFTLTILGQRHVGVSRAALLLSLEGVMTAVVGYLALSETLTYIEMLGAGLMFFSTTITTLEGEGGCGEEEGGRQRFVIQAVEEGLGVDMIDLQTDESTGDETWEASLHATENPQAQGCVRSIENYFKLPDMHRSFQVDTGQERGPPNVVVEMRPVAGQPGGSLSESSRLAKDVPTMKGYSSLITN